MCLSLTITQESTNVNSSKQGLLSIYSETENRATKVMGTSGTFSY
jgi:hypothetical protein